MDNRLISKPAQICIEKFLDKIQLHQYSLHITKATVRGDNFLGMIFKLVVRGKESNGNVKTLHLIVKSAPKNVAFREHTNIRPSFLREIYVYTEVLPLFRKFQEERSIESPFNSYAVCYETLADELDETLIMENMQKMGYVVTDRSVTLDLNHAVLVMKEYGRYHALTFALRDQNPQMFEELAKNMEDKVFNKIVGDDSESSSKQGMRATTERGLAALDPVADKEAYDRFRTYHERAHDLIKNVVSSKAAGRYAVFGHGDCWLNNILFKYENPEKPTTPTALCFLDWQFARLGSPALDLSNFLSICIDHELRDKHYDYLIREYYESLSNFLRHLGSDANKLFPFDVLEEHLRKFSVYGLHLALISLYLIVSDREEIPDLQNALSEQDALEKFQFETRNIQKYYDRFRPVVNHCVKRNYEF